MEVDPRMLPSNVVYLSTLCGSTGGVTNGVTNGNQQQYQQQQQQQVHKCNHACQVEYVWANLYRCVTTGNAHVCDKNCNQRILYDNLSSICRVSGQIFPLSAAELEATKCVRRKRDFGALEGRCSKQQRRCDAAPRHVLRSSSPSRLFGSRTNFHFAAAATAAPAAPAAAAAGVAGQSSMDLS